MDSSNVKEITVYDGKYTFRFHKNGDFECYRYGEPWRDFVGDGAVLALFQEVERLREKYEERCWCSSQKPADFLCGHKSAL